MGNGPLAVRDGCWKCHPSTVLSRCFSGVARTSYAHNLQNGHPSHVDTFSKNRCVCLAKLFIPLLRLAGRLCEERYDGVFWLCENEVQLVIFWNLMCQKDWQSNRNGWDTRCLRCTSRSNIWPHLPQVVPPRTFYYEYWTEPPAARGTNSQAGDHQNRPGWLH